MVNKLTAMPVEINWNPGLPIYASEAFLHSEADEFGWIGGSGDKSDLRCVLPYTIVRKAGFRMVRFRTESIPLVDSLDLEDERSFLNSVVEYFRSTGAGMIVPSGNTAIFRTYPDGAVAAPYGTVVMDLSLPEEVLLGEIRKTFRQNIRKAVTAGVQIKCGLEYLDVSYQLIAETLKRSGVDFKAYDGFKRKVSSFGEHIRIFVAEHEGVIQGCVVAPFSDHTAYNCYAGSRVEPVLGAMHLLHWEAIRQFRAMGVKRFDFQGVRINPEKGSKQAGILHYKEGFGGRLVQGYQWKYSLRPLNSIAYSLAVRLLLGGDIVDQEQSKFITQ
jgi:hypothetical protein